MKVKRGALTTARTPSFDLSNGLTLTQIDGQRVNIYTLEPFVSLRGFFVKLATLRTSRGDPSVKASKLAFCL